jgi:hypothetical protein
LGQHGGNVFGRRHFNHSDNSLTNKGKTPVTFIDGVSYTEKSRPDVVSWWHVYSVVWHKVMENRLATQNIKYISCFGTIVLHCKKSLSLLCDARSTALTNRLRYRCDIISTKDSLFGV